MQINSDKEINFEKPYRPNLVNNNFNIAKPINILPNICNS